MKKRYAQSVFPVAIARNNARLYQLLLVSFLFAFVPESWGQVAITYPQQAQDIISCNQSGDLRVRLRFTSGNADAPVVTVNLPPGVHYETGSLTSLGGNLSIAEADLSDPEAPQFSIAPADITADDVVDFSISRSGGCEARIFAVNGGLFKDTLTVETAAGHVTENNPNLNTYNLLFASLSHQYPNGPSSQDTIITDVPQTINRQVRLTQGGLGYVDSVSYFVVLGDIQDYALWYGGAPLVPDATSGDTLFYELTESLIPGIFGGDGRFSNGEQIDFQERFVVETCTQALNRAVHHAYWGCGGTICQRTIPATGSVAVIVPQPSIETGKLFDRNLPACLDGNTPDQFGFFIENTGENTAKISFQVGFEGNTNLPVFGDYNANNAALDTASIELLLNGEDITRSPDEVYDGVNFCQDGLPKGEVSAARYFDFTLQPGDRLEIRGEYVYCCRESCNFSFSWPTPITRFQVRDACGNIPRALYASHDFAGARLGTTPTIISGPATIFDGQTATYCFQYPSLDGYPNISGDNTYAVELELPAGFDLQATGDAQVSDKDGNALPFEFLGIGTGRPAILINQSDYSGGSVEFCLDLAWNCSSAGFVELPVVLYQTVGSSCPEQCYLGISCSAFPVLLFCPGGGCDSGGGRVSYSETQRVNLGFADPDNERAWITGASADPGLARLDRVAPGDTIRTAAGLTVENGGAGAWTEGRFRQTMIYPYFKSLGATARIFDNGTLMGEVGGIPLSNMQGDSLFEFELSAAILHGLDPGFPESYVFSPGDSVYLEVFYTFDPGLAQGDFYDYQLDGFSPNTDFCVENQDIRNSFHLSNNNFQSFDACGITIDRVQLIAAAVSFASGGTGNFTGCEELTWEVFTRTQRGCVSDDVLDFFPNEFRPVFAFDTFALAKIPGYTFKRLQYRRSPGIFTIDIAPFAEDADSLYFDIRNAYSDRGGPIPLWEEQARDEILKSFWQPSCASEEGTFYGHARVQYEDPASGVLYSQDRSRLLGYTPTGQFGFVLNPLVNNAFTEENCYTLSVANTGVGSGFDVAYSWLEVVSEDVAVAVESVRENGGDVISLNTAGIYALGQHPNNTTEQIEICVSQTSCLPDSFLVVYGWNCEGYPGLDNPVESCFLDTLVAYINPQLAEVQLQITDQPNPSDPLELCDTDTIAVLVNSAQQADLVNPVLDVILPPGVEVNSMTAGYPNNANIVFEPLPGLVNGDTVTFDLTAHSLVAGDSLPGTFSNPDIANRQMQVVFEIETGCGFDPTKTVALYRARGLSPCSDPAIGSDILVASNPINVVGTDAPYRTMPEVTVDGSLSGCGSTARVTVGFSLMGAGTTGRDTAELIVPPGVGYVTGSLLCDSPDPGSCPTYIHSLVNEDGLTAIRFALPAGLSEGIAIAFSFEIEDQGAACTEVGTGLFRTLVTRDPLSCDGIPCLTELEVTTGQAALGLVIQKTSYAFTSPGLCVDPENASFQLQAGLALSGPGQSAADRVAVRAYCADTAGAQVGGLLAEVVFEGVVAPGTVLPVEMSGELCATASGIWMEASPTCGCDTTRLFLPLSYTTEVACPADFSVCLDAAPVELSGATPGGGVFEGPGVIDGSFDPALAGAGVHALVYTFTDDMGCQGVCTFQATVQPLPEVSCPAPFTVCTDAGPVDLNGGVPQGGVFSGAGVENGVFDPTLAGPGVHELTYTYTDANGCGSSCTFEVTVAPLPVLSCPPDLEVALLDDAFVLEGATPIGGTYSGPGVSNNSFDPAVVGAGEYTIVYTYTTALGCPESCSFTISVTAGFAELGDFVWLDENQNGLQDIGEEGLPGVQVILERMDGSGFFPVDTTLTNIEGYYQFLTLPGPYRVRFVPDSGLEATLPLQGSNAELDSDILPDGRVTGVYTLEEGAVNLSVDAGFYSVCDNVTDPGQIGPDQYLCAPGNTPEPILSLSAPEGGSGEIEYLWMRSTVAGPFNQQTWRFVPNSNTPDLAPGPLSETTYFARCARRDGCITFLETNIVEIEVGDEAVAEINGPIVLCVGEPATFTATDAGPGAVYEWEMSLGLSPVSATGPEVTLSAPFSHGRFSIILSVTANGCTAIQTRQITATHSPFYCGTPMPLSANITNAQGVSSVKLDWMLEELEPGYTYTVMHAMAGDQIYQPVARYDKPMNYIGNACFYEHLHENPEPGVHHYRVTIQKPNGEVVYSEEATVVLLDEVLLFPNPAREMVTISLANPFGAGDRLELYNALGQRLRTFSVRYGDRQLDVDVSQLPAGPYVFRLLRGQTRWEVLPFVKE